MNDLSFIDNLEFKILDNSLNYVKVIGMEAEVYCRNGSFKEYISGVIVAKKEEIENDEIMKCKHEQCKIVINHLSIRFKDKTIAVAKYIIKRELIAGYIGSMKGVVNLP